MIPKGLMSKACAFVLAVCLMAMGCASIIGGGGSQNVTIGSTRSGVQFEIFDVTGAIVQSGTTPATVLLKRGAGFFKAAEYTVKYRTPEGTKIQTITHKLNGWYIGNILIGGIIGFLIVDPLTGAMYTLPENINLNIKYGPSEDLRIYSLQDVKPEMRKYLVKINN